MNKTLTTADRMAIQECIDYLAPAAKDFSDLGMGDSKHARCIRTLRAILAAQQPEPRAEVTDEQPSLTNPLTPYGMLVRALRIVAGVTLMDMATALLTTPAKLSAMEFGRAPVTPEFAFDVAAYFDALDVPHTASALRAAVAARAGEGQ